MKRKLLATVLSITLAISMAMPSFAYEADESIVAAPAVESESEENAETPGEDSDGVADGEEGEASSENETPEGNNQGDADADTESDTSQNEDGETVSEDEEASEDETESDIDETEGESDENDETATDGETPGEDSLEEDEETEEETIEAVVEEEDILGEAGSNQCGTNATWSFEEATGILTISGTGAIEGVYDATIVKYNYSFAGKKDVTKKVVIGEGITEIGPEAFRNFSILTSVDFPTTLTQIGYCAFNNCQQLGNFTLPANLKKIGNNAFEDCKAITSVTLPGSLKDDNGPALDIAIFKGCSNLKTVVIQNGVDQIPKEMFDNCTALESISIPKTTTQFLSKFEGCPNITTIEIDGLNPAYTGSEDKDVIIFRNENCLGVSGESLIYVTPSCTTIPHVAYVASNVFKGRTDLTSITIPAEVNYIMQGAFEDCDNLKTVEFANENELREIGGSAFAGCEALEEISFENCNNTLLKSIQAGAFKNCTSLKTVKLPNTVTTIGGGTGIGVFQGCTSLEEFVFPENCCGIAPYMFKDCTSLNSITLNECQYGKDHGNESIGEHAFEGCTSLTELTFHSKIRNIGDRSFAGCTNLTKISFMADYDIVINCENGNYHSCDAFADCTNLKVYMYSKAVRLKKHLVNHNIPYELFDPAPVEYNVVFDGNGSTSGYMEAMRNLYENKDYYLPANKYVRKGYSFTGWNSERDGSGLSLADKSYFAAYMFTPPPVISGETEMLYAQWDRNEYTINYVNMEGATNPNPSGYNVDSSTIALRTPSRTGYTFGGWYTSNKYKTKVTSIPKGSTGNRTIYAKWTVNKYTVKFNKNGGTGTTKSMSCVCNKDYNLRANKFKRKGYQFLGWSTSKSSTVPQYLNGASINNITTRNKGSVTLYAVWEKLNYTITYENIDGISGANPNTGVYTVTDTFKLKNVSKPGYTFKGWYKDAKCKKKVTKITKGTIGDKKLYAKFAANKYWVEYRPNGGTGGVVVDKGTYTDGKLGFNPYIGIPERGISPYTKEGYRFAGWSTNPNANYATDTLYDYEPEMKYFATSQKPKKIILYAIWEPE